MQRRHGHLGLEYVKFGEDAQRNFDELELLLGA